MIQLETWPAVHFADHFEASPAAIYICSSTHEHICILHRKHSTLSLASGCDNSGGKSLLGTAFTAACFLPDGKWTLLAEDGLAMSPVETGDTGVCSITALCSKNSGLGLPHSDDSGLELLSCKDSGFDGF